MMDFARLLGFDLAFFYFLFSYFEQVDVLVVRGLTNPTIPYANLTLSRALLRPAARAQHNSCVGKKKKKG